MQPAVAKIAIIPMHIESNGKFHVDVLNVLQCCCSFHIMQYKASSIWLDSKFYVQLEDAIFFPGLFFILFSHFC